MSVSNLGVMQRTATLMTSPYIGEMVKLGAESVFSIWTYWYYDYTNIRQNLISLNHDTDAVTICEGPLGRPYQMELHPVDGKLYLSTQRSSSSGRMAAYDYHTGVCTDIESAPGVYCPTYEDAFGPDGAQCVTYSDETNKRVFWGSSGVGALWAWDPVLETFQDYGILDKAAADVDYLRYIYSIQVDATYAYCEMKQSSSYGANNVCYLCIVNLSTGVVTPIWYGTAGLTNANVYRHSNGNIYINTTTGVLASDWWITDGENTPVGIGSNPGCYSVGYRRPLTFDGYATNGNLAFPDGVGGKDVILRYKRTGDTDYREKTTAILTLDDYPVQRVGLDQDRNVVCTGPAYSALTRYNMTSSEKEIVGRVPSSGYGIAADTPRDLLWISGYVRALCKYDASLPLSATNPLAITGLPNSTETAYFYDIYRASDNNIWIVANWIRTALGTEVIWYNPDTTASASIQGFLSSYLFQGSAINRGRTKIVVSARDTTTGDGVLVVVHTAKKAIHRILRPIDAGTTQGSIVSVETNKDTANLFVGITMANGYKTYCVDIETGDLVWGPNDLVGLSSCLGSRIQFSHGYVWFYVYTGGLYYIAKIDPATGTVTNNVLAVTASGGMVWSGETLCHHDSTTKSLYLIPAADLGLQGGLEK